MRRSALLTQEDRARLDVAADWTLRLQAEDLGEAQLAEWLEWYDDPGNRVAFDEMQAVRSDVRAIDADVRRAFAARFAKHGPNTSKWIPPLRWVPAFATIAALVAGVVAWQFGWLATATVNASYATARSDHRLIHLPDSSLVTLGAHSSLSINFTGDARYLVLEGGEALFNVAHDSARPFTVQAGRLRIRAIGTQFNVRRAEESTFVSVKEGVVEVAQDRVTAAVPGIPGAADRMAAPEVVRVVAGRQAMAAARRARIELVAVAPETVANWQDGRLEFVDESLRTVIATVNRYSAREIVLTDPVALGELRFTGIVMERHIDDWVNAIQEVFPLKANTAGKGAILLSPALP